jgi:hypothetical protein
MLPSWTAAGKQQFYMSCHPCESRNPGSNRKEKTLFRKICHNKNSTKDFVRNFQQKNAKQTQFFPVFQPKMAILQKNKANSNPIQTQTNPILAQKQGNIMKTNPIKPN